MLRYLIGRRKSLIKLTLIESKRISAGKQKNNGLVPLCKVRYNRVVRYMGEETINFPGPNGTTVQYPKNDGSNPDDYIIEDYVMDYIIQPLDKTRQNLSIDLTYTAIDFPPFFNLSKKEIRSYNRPKYIKLLQNYQSGTNNHRMYQVQFNIYHGRNNWLNNIKVLIL